MKTINFSYNWNNKLDCKAYTTFRLYNPSKYVVGDIYQIRLKDKPVHQALLVDIRRMSLDKVNEFIAHIDTGYSLDEFRNIVRKMYTGADNKEFCLLLLKKT